MLFFENLFSFLFGKKKVENSIVVVKKQWREENGFIYFSVTSKGKSGSEWIRIFEKSGIVISATADSLLRSMQFVATSGQVTEVAIFKDLNLIKNSDNYTTVSEIKKVLKENESLICGSIETMCLIAEALSEDDFSKMGLNRIELMKEFNYPGEGPFNLTFECKHSRQNDTYEKTMCSHFLSGPGGGGFIPKNGGRGFVYLLAS